MELVGCPNFFQAGTGGLATGMRMFTHLVSSVRKPLLTQKTDLLSDTLSSKTRKER